MADVATIQRLLKHATPEELAEIDRLLDDGILWHALPGPQTEAYESLADIVGYGGAAGGGKTDFLAGTVVNKSKRALVVRREKAQTEGVVQRLEEIVGNKDGYNSQKGFWRLPGGVIAEFAGLDNPGDERRWQGRPHDKKLFDEATEMRESQVRFIMGWTRSNDPTVRPQAILTFNPPTTVEGRWVIKFFGPWLDPKHPNPAKPGELRWFTTVGDNQDYEVDDGREFVLEGNKTDGYELVYDFNPDDYTPEQIVQPKSRTFIPARLTDNPYYMATGYMSTLQALPEPLRSQMLRGDFMAGTEDDAMQVIPTHWVEIAQARWEKPDVLPAMDSLGVDVARGGKDNTVLIARHGMWFSEATVVQGEGTNTGPKVAGLVVQTLRDHAPVHLDVIGVGASPYDYLNDMGVQVMGVNVAESSLAKDKSGRLSFVNLRSQLWWQMREALDPDANNGIALPPDPALLAELCTPRWELSGFRIKVESREEIIKPSRGGRSPDRASALILANMDTPRRAIVARMRGQSQRGGDYDPMRLIEPQRTVTQDYDPLHGYR